jgi:hypothetical protein
MGLHSQNIMVFLFVAILILAVFSPLLVPRVRSDTSEATVVSYSVYMAPANTYLAENVGDLVAVGEVQNVGSTVIATVFVAGYAYDSSGNLLDSNEAQVFTNDLSPGQKAPFYLDFIPENSVTQDNTWIPDVSNVSIEVTFVTDSNATQYPSLTINGVQASNVAGVYKVTGNVYNNGGEAANSVYVDATFYNSSGSVIGLNYTSYLSSPLAPGDSAPFSATPTDNSAQLSGEITNYSLLIQSGSIGSSPQPSGSTFTLPSTQPLTQPTPTPVSSSSTPVKSSNSSGFILPITVIVVIMAVVIISALIFLRRRSNKHLLPPPPPTDSS